MTHSQIKANFPGWLTIPEFMKKHKLKTRKSVYDWEKRGKVEIMKIGYASLIRINPDYDEASH